MPKELLNSKNKGFSIVEILIALALFLIALAAVMPLAWSSQDLLVDNQRAQEALIIARQILTEARQQARSNFTNLKSSNANAPPYQTTLTISSRDNFIKEAVATVSWKSLSGKQQTISLDTVVTDWQSVISGSSCTIGESIDNYELKNVFALPETSEPTSIAVKNDLAYMTLNSPDPGDADLLVMNLEDPGNPYIVSSLDTGPGLYTIAITNTYAFVGNASINGQLQIIDIRNPAQPQLITTFKLPGNYNDNTTIPNTMIYRDNKVFMGLQKSQIEEFQVVDVNNINSPRVVGSFEIDAGINQILIDGSLAYIASPANEEVKMLGIGNLASIQQIDAFDASGGSGNGKSLAKSDDLLYLGRTIGRDELYILDTKGKLKEIATLNLNTSVIGLISTSRWLLLATTDGSNSIQFWRKNNDTPTRLRNISLPGRIRSFACGKQTLYVATQNPNGINIITPLP